MKGSVGYFGKGEVEVHPWELNYIITFVNLVVWNRGKQSPTKLFLIL